LKTLRYVLLVILALIAGSTLGNSLSVFGVEPDLVLLVLIHVAVSAGRIQGTLFGFLAGFLQDVYSPGRLGINAFTNSIIGFGAGYAHGGVVTESLSVRALIIFSATFVHDIIYFFLRSSGNPGDAAVLLFRYGFPTALYTTAVGITISFVLFTLRKKGG